MVKLTKEQISRRVELTNKLRDQTITREEAEELKFLLDLEKQTAMSINDAVALLAIAFLTGAVISFS